MSSGSPTQTPAWSCDTHKHEHYQHRELQQRQQFQLASLRAELQRATQLWFHTKSDKSFQLLVQATAQILQHGLQPSSNSKTYRLIKDFELLRPTERQQQTESFKNCQATISEFLLQWTASCLQESCLVGCIQTLLADKELLDQYYQRNVAYLRQSYYATSLLICLRAVQQNERSLLDQLEPLARHKRHQRTSSQPNCSLNPRLHVVQEEESAPGQQLLRRIKSLPSMDNMQSKTSAAEIVQLRSRCPNYSQGARLRARLHGIYMKRSELALSESSNSTASASSYSQTATPGSSCRIQLINCDNIKIWTDQTSSSSNSETPPPTAAADSPAATKTVSVKHSSPLHSFLGNLFGTSPIYTSWYNKSLGQEPVEGSVLDSFLPVNGRKLDKRQQQSLFEGISMLNDDNNRPAEATATAPWDIVGSQQSQASNSYGSTTPGSLSSNSVYSGSNKVDNQSLAAFLQTSRSTHNNTELEKENAHFLISEACITAIEHVKWSRLGHSARNRAQELALRVTAEADALLMPYAEQQDNPNSSSASSNNNNNSAEAVGLQLISRFNDLQLPKLVDLKWLVSEQDAPQQLLPMPKAHAQDQQLLEDEQHTAGVTRGTRTWAPPRQQIIFTEHAPANRSQLLKRQHYRCAGCGMHVARQYQRHFRYCNYLGKYLCTGCHRNQLSAIPARILQSWDFRSYAVSSFAYRLIEQMYAFPLFHVPDLNDQLYAQEKFLARARRRRQQLKYVRDFIATCRFAIKEQTIFGALPEHITNDPDTWSMCDFVDVQNKSMCRSIEELIALTEQHVFKCVLCTGRAFVCEYCKNPKVIYPWQRKIQRCVQCGVCAHYNCWKANSGGNCARCARMQGRSHQTPVKSSASGS